MAMSDENRFFRFLWRLNALLIAFFFMALGLSIGALVLMKFFSADSPKRGSKSPDSSKFVKVSAKTDTVEEFEIGEPDVIKGNDYWIIPLHRRQTDTYNSHSVRSDANLLFLNIKDGSKLWLAKDNSQLIQSRLWLTDSLISPNQLRVGRDEDSQISYLRVIYRVVEEDSDGNGLLTTQDKVSIFTSRADGTGYSLLVEPADKILLTRQTTDDQFMVMYNKDGQTLYQIFDIREAKPIFNGKIDIPELPENIAPD